MKNWFLKILPLAFLAFACKTPQNIERINLAHVYQHEGVVLKPQFAIYHLNADSTRIYFEGSSDQLLYVKDQKSGVFKAHFSVRYKLYTDYSRTVLLDSGTVRKTDEQLDHSTKLLSGSFVINTSKKSPEKKYILEIVMTDMTRNLSYLDIFSLDKSDKLSRQNFLLSSKMGKIIYSNHVPLNVPFYLKNNASPKSYMVRYYDREFPIAATPYAKNVELTFKYKADSIFEVDANHTIVLQKPGFYHFLVDGESKSGFTIFNYYNEFPFITRRENLGPPLRYLTTREEFDAFDKTDDHEMKLEIDKFWLKLSGTPDRGKLMVSTFYNRVETANENFSSYLEGWKTDRGIIFVVLGPPTEVRRNELQETWIYGDPTSSLNFVFTFTKLKNPFSENDYALNRSNAYRYGWAMAVESWRNGAPFGIKEIKRAQDERDRQTRVNTPPYFWY